MENKSRIFDGLMVLQYLAGNQKALGMLVKRHHSRICRHVLWYTGDPEISKDIAQETWRTVILKMETLKEPNKFGSWAMTIATHKSLDYLARVKAERRDRYWGLAQVSEDEAEVMENKSHQLARLKVAIKKLSREHQVVLRLFYLEEQSLFEIASILNLSVGTIKSRLFHAREKLKSQLK